jgi:hypothetical protein
MRAWDCFTFCDELDLLEIRLAELAGAVHRHVLAEAPVTFSGEPKPLHYAGNRARFRRWADRIVHVVVGDMPGGPDRWARERHQRDALWRGLDGVGRDDLVMVSDADELARASIIPALARACQDGPRGLHLTNYHYWLNGLRAPRWPGHAACLARDLPDGLDRLRKSFGRLRETPGLDGGGWHFTFLGGPAAVMRKFRAYSHADSPKRCGGPRGLAESVKALRDPFLGKPVTPVPLDETFPAHLLAHRERFGHLVHPGPFDKRAADG